MRDPMHLLKWINFYPPLFGAGIRVIHTAPDFRTVRVQMKLTRLNLNVVMEPGRFLVGNAGILVTRVQYVKNGPSKKFVIVDAGMNDLIRPPLYQAYHEVIPVEKTRGLLRADVVGPICESGDFFALDRQMPKVKAGDLLAVLSAGAYSFSMSSNYNSRGRAAEVMVYGKKSALVRRRETWNDLIRSEQIPRW
jgi:diaminopimelate decarboxylase